MFRWYSTDQARDSSYLTILQWPLLIDELDVNPRHPIDPRASRSNRGVCRDSVLFASHSNETSLWNLQRREKCSAIAADVLSHSLFSFNNGATFVNYFNLHIDGNGMSRLSALIFYREWHNYTITRRQRLKS